MSTTRKLFCFFSITDLNSKSKPNTTRILILAWFTVSTCSRLSDYDLIWSSAASMIFLDLPYPRKLTYYVLVYRILLGTEASFRTVFSGSSFSSFGRPETITAFFLVYCSCSALRVFRSATSLPQTFNFCSICFKHLMDRTKFFILIFHWTVLRSRLL